MFEGLKKRFSGKNKAGGAMEAQRVKGARAPRTLESYSVAATFAQAGMQDTAQAMIQQELKERPKILVVGREASFSAPLVEYAVGFAKRMGYDIVALNCVPFGHEAPEVLQPFKEELCKEFECKAVEGAELLAKRAAEEGVHWVHMVKFGPADQCIRELHNEIRRLEFVLMEPEKGAEEGLEPAIPVFCLAE